MCCYMRNVFSLRSNNSNLFLTLCPTVSVFNIYYLSDYLDWAKTMEIYTYYNILHYPPSHSIKNLPDKLKEVVSSRLTATEFNIVKNFLHLSRDNDKLVNEFIAKNEELDKFRKQDFKTTFGEWGQLVMEYKNE